MSVYRAPLQDMQFVLNELAGLEQVGKLPGFEDATPDTVAAVLEEASKFATEVLVASCRHPIHVVEAARMGADIATCPPAVIDQLFNHPLTTIGLEKFLKDWEKSQAVKAV